MDNTAIILLVMFVFYSVLLMIIKSKKGKMKDAGLLPKKLPFINMLFQYTFLPTLILQILLKVEFHEFLILYGYFALILYIAEYTYRKAKSDDNSQAHI